MSTSAPAPDAQGEALGYFVTSGIPELVKTLISVRRLAVARGLEKVAEESLAIMEGLLNDINLLSNEMAAIADAAIARKMFDTQSGNRPLTGQMESHVRSEPGPLGTVRVALIAELNKIVNSRGYGPFWRAQEYGTGTSQVPSQVGRPLFGTFEPSGDPPDSAQRGLGQGHDLAFIPFGSAPGFGRISVELPGRHFLRDGIAEAGAKYTARMDAIQKKYVTRLNALTEQVRTASAASRVRGVRGIIQA